VNPESNTPTTFPFSNDWMQISELEKHVFLLAKEFIKKHHVLDVHDLSYQVTRSLGDSANHTLISQAIQDLIAKKIIFEGGLLTRETALENETRKLMLDLIRKRPGIRMSVIRNILSKDSKTILIHLKILERFGLVRFETIAGNKAYFDINAPRDLDVFHHFVQQTKVLEILTALIENPGASQDDLDEIMKDSISPQTLASKVRVLFEYKLITGRVKSSRFIALKVMARYTKLVLLLGS